MASVSVKVDISEKALERVINESPETKSAINSLSNQIANRANAMAQEISGIWHETGKPHNPERKGGEWVGSSKDFPTIGGVEARYDSKPAKLGSDGLVGIVFSANYAAQKDNHLHNTLLKAKG